MKKTHPATALAIILFFLLFPVAGLLFAWNDVHTKMRKNAVEFINLSYVDFYESLQNGDPNNDSSVEFRDSYDAAKYARTGAPKILNIKPLKTYAREESDRGIQYAELEVKTQIGSTTETYTVLIRQPTVAPRWRYVKVEPLSR